MSVARELARRGAMLLDTTRDTDDEPAALTEHEAERVLWAQAARSVDDPLAEVLARQAMRVGQEGDFALQHAALRAMLERLPPKDLRVRRIGGGKRGLGAARGEFVVSQGPGRLHAKQEVWVEDVAPLEAACGCRDFLRCGLGVCRHVLAVLLRLAPKRNRPWPNFAAFEALRWDPIHPLRGPSEPWRRLRIVAAPAEGAGAVLRTAGKGKRSAGPRAVGSAAVGSAAVDSAAVDSAAVGSAGPRRAPHPIATQELPSSLRLANRASDPEALARGLKRLARGSGVVSPSAAAVLDGELRRAEALAGASRRAPAATRALTSMKRPLYPYQREAVLRFLGSGSLLIADDMGLGKTTQAIGACHALVKSGAISRVLLVVPASLKPQWRREWVATTDVPIHLVDGRAEERRVSYEGGPGVLCIGYEQLRADLTRIQAWDPELVVLDEAQRIKNHETQTAHAVARLTPRYRLALTGTPMQNRLSELASVVSFVDGTALGPAWQVVARHTFQVGDAGSGKSGARYLDQLRERLSQAMVRRLRTEVIEQLPARTDTRVPVALTPAQWDAHEEYDFPIRQLMSIRQKRPLTKAERERLMMMLGQQRRISNGLAQRDFATLWPTLRDQCPAAALMDSLDAPKLAVLRDLVTTLAVEQGRKVVVFSEWRAMLRLSEWVVRDVLEAAGLRAAFFTGRETPKMREHALVDFHDDPTLRVLFLTDAGGVGLNLQRAASTCIQLELPWNPAVMEQRIGRIYRLGQTKPIEVFHLASETGIESKIVDLLGRKKALSAALLDENQVEVRFDTGAGIFELASSLEVGPSADEPEAQAPAGADEASYVTAHESVGAAEGVEASHASPAASPGGAQEPRPEQASLLASGMPASLAPATCARSLAPPATADVEPLATAVLATAPTAAVPTAQDEFERLAGSTRPSTERGLRVTPRPDGGLSFDVPPDLAAPMAALLRTMAAMLDRRPADR